LHENVKNGSLLSEAMGNFPKIFDVVSIGLVSSSEKIGNLHIAFSGIVDHLKWSSDIKRKIVKAIRYPIFTLIIGIAVMSVMTTVVVPKITSLLLATSGEELPFMTIALVNFSNFLISNGIFMIISLIGIIILYKIGRINESILLFTDKIKLKIPFFGSLVTKIDASRFSHFFATTFSSGIGVIESLSSGKQIISNMAIRNSISGAIVNIEEGSSLTNAIKNTGYFPDLVVSIIRTGEDSGNISVALENVSFFYDREINDSIDAVIGMMQPALTLVMGLMIAWIATSVFGPVYNSFSKFQ
jgi:type IV pilus assembly protein PilC